jgi:D-alanyl-lipoteichoic acid acyltransferase DltB (MBOAT superfamily)
MLLGGLWHGAAWTFVAWGFLHGLYLALERSLRKVMPAFFESRALLNTSLIGATTFFLVTLSPGCPSAPRPSRTPGPCSPPCSA